MGDRRSATPAPTDRLEVVAQLASLINTTYDLDAIFRSAVLGIRGVIDFRRASVVLVSEDRATYKLHTLFDDARGGFIKESGVFPVDSGLTGRVIRTGEPVREDNFAGYPDIRLEGEGHVAVLVLPLRADDQVIGALVLGGHRAAQYGEEDLTFAALLARQIETSLRYSRLFAQLAEQRDAVRTEHGRVESARARLAALIEASEAAIMLVTDDGVDHANGLMAALVGMPKEVIQGATLERVHASLSRALTDGAQLESQQAALREGTPLHDRVEFAFPTRAICERTVAPVHDPAGGTLGHVVIYRDVTREAEAEAAKDEFVSIVSHELRTPLTSVNTSLNLLHRGASGTISNAARELIEIGRRNVERLIRLVDDLLDLARIRHGRLEVRTSAVPVERVAREALDATQGFGEEREVRLDVDPSDVDVWVHADPDRLVQVLVNLLANAVKFSPAGARVALRWWSDESSVMIEVADEGPGMPADKLDVIFDRFRQLEQPATRRHGGAGLGLTISRAIVERLGGSIEVESQVGEGSRFVVRLPRAPASATPGAAAAAREGSLDTVVVAHRDPDTRELIMRLCTAEGWHPVAAGDGAEALSESVSTDVLVLGDELSDMHPLELLEHVRGNPATVDVPTLVVGPQVDRSSAVQFGADEWVPEVGPRLVDAIRRVAKIPRRPIVILVEDDPQVRDSLTRLLRGAGCRCLVARTADEGLALLRQRLPALLITDLRLPGVDGLALVQAVRADPASAGLPVIVITGFIDPETVRAFEELGAPVVSKPFELAELRRRINRVLQLPTGSQRSKT